MISTRITKFGIGQVVRHREQGFRGVVIDVDAEYGGQLAWLANLPDVERPDLDQPFYHLLAETGEDASAAYVSEQSLVADDSGEPVRHPHLPRLFQRFERNRYIARARLVN